MSVLANANAMGAGGVDTGDIGHSLRFRSGATAYLTRTSGSPTDKSKWTLSFWVKRAELSRQQILFGATINASANFSIEFSAANNFQIFFTNTLALVSSEVERDPTAYTHFVISYDSGNATASNRCRVWKNGSEITSWSTDNRASIGTANDAWNTNALLHYIGSSSALYKNDDYKARITFVDGTSVTDATSFGYLNTEINEWVSKSQSAVKAVVDAGGANSFMLDFDDGTSLTTLGYDKSSKGNNWTLNNFSLTAGTSYDWMLDVPGNSYATLNPLDIKPTAITLANGNLSASATAVACKLRASQGMSADKWYFEFTATSANNQFGVALISSIYNAYVGGDSASYGYFANDGNKYNNGSATAYGSTYTTNDVIGVAYDASAGKLYFSKNGTWQNSGDPTAGTNPAFSGMSGTFYPAISGAAAGATASELNFGQAPLHASATYDAASGGYFRYTPPSGYKALCQRNLPDGESITTSGSFTGTLAADGPYVDIKGVPLAMTINGNAVTFGTHADKTSSGFKIRTASSSYNNTGSNTYSVSSTGPKRKYSLAQGNP